MSSEKMNMQTQADHLNMKYVGTGHADISKFDWLQHQHRDSLASYYGHVHMAQAFAVAQNQSLGRVKYELLQRMPQPIGPAPTADDEKEKD